MAAINRIIPTKSMRLSSNLPSPLFGKTKIANKKETIINGKFTMKMEGQSQVSIRNPPIEGPKAADVDAKIDNVAKAVAWPFVMLVLTILIPLGKRVELPIA